MQIEWDIKKDRTNRLKHGIGFAEAALIFDGPLVTRTDERRDYGEVRSISIGKITDLLIVVVVHTDRQNRVRLISARRANREERRRYDEYLEGKN